MVRSSREDEKSLLEEIYQVAQRRRAANKAGVPQAGIIFLVKGKLFIDSTPVSEAEGYAHFKIHSRDHHQYWGQLQRMKAVPMDLEYDEVPRGRTVYDTRAGKYTLFLDRCILKNKKLVSRIIVQMNLPIKSTETSTDDRYRCRVCLRKAG
jgi:hypothetical protein